MDSRGDTTGAPRSDTDAAVADLIREALAGLDSGVVRLGDLRATLECALALLGADEKAPR